jgi:osmotically-inducible protein OsmY
MKSITVIGTAAAVALLSGCEPKRSVSADAESAPPATNSTLVNRVSETTSNVVNSTSNALGNAADAVKGLVSATTNVDNSGINVRDRDGATLTPGDQGNSPADIERTQMIRKALATGTNDFSVVARNVKIVTVNGKVTLRGPVNTESEKNGIAAIASTIAGQENVDDQIEVKPAQQ